MHWTSQVCLLAGQGQLYDKPLYCREADNSASQPSGCLAWLKSWVRLGNKQLSLAGADLRAAKLMHGMATSCLYPMI